MQTAHAIHSENAAQIKLGKTTLNFVCVTKKLIAVSTMATITLPTLTAYAIPKLNAAQHKTTSQTHFSANVTLQNSAVKETIMETTQHTVYVILRIIAVQLTPSTRTPSIAIANLAYNAAKVTTI